MGSRTGLLAAALGALTFAGIAPAQTEAIQEAVDQNADIRVEIKVTRRATGETVYFDSDEVMAECPEWLCGAAPEPTRSEGYARYNDGDCHNIDRILSASLQRGTGASTGIAPDGSEYFTETRIVMTQSVFDNGSDSSTGVVPKVPPPPCPVREEDLIAVVPQ